MSLALRPVYCQTTLTTGMLMDGKMSVGVRSRTNGVSNKSSKAATTKVYGRRRAKRTIHILCPQSVGEFPQFGRAARTRSRQQVVKRKRSRTSQRNYQADRNSQQVVLKTFAFLRSEPVHEEPKLPI